MSMQSCLVDSISVSNYSLEVKIKNVLKNLASIPAL